MAAVKESVVAYFGTGDEGFAACLMLDLRARGLEVVDARQLGEEPYGGVLVIRSWFADQPRFSDEQLTAFRAAHVPTLVVRRNGTKLSRDEGFGGWSHMALWGDYYQANRTLGGKGAGGIGNVLGFYSGGQTRIDLPAGYVFVSYHHDTDGEFVREWLRPFLSMSGITTWDYRMSERIPDPKTAEPVDPAIVGRLRELIRSAGAVLVVAGESWSSPYSRFEVETARGLGVPVLGVQAVDRKPSDDPTLADVPISVIWVNQPRASKLVTALQGAGVRPFGG